MTILVDSNILLRLANVLDPQFALADNAVAKLLGKQEQLCVVPQTFYEFWVVATRPVKVNGLGLTSGQADSELVKFKREYLFLDERPAFFTEWEALVRQYAIVGKNGHDTRLGAAMLVHAITHLLTFNKQDFQRFTNITALTPAEVMALP